MFHDRVDRLQKADHPFKSFWMGGFEGADHRNGHGIALDMAQMSAHVAQRDDDYARAAALGLRTIRESIGWRLTESTEGRFDLDRVRSIAASARRHGLQVIWTLMHYGTPSGVSLLDDAFIERFRHYAVAVATALRETGERAPVYNLVNEIGFTAWVVSATNEFHPHRNHRRTSAEEEQQLGYDVKRRLVKATVAATLAVRKVDPSARFLQVEPIIHVSAPWDRPDLQEHAEAVTAHQWQVWDMLAGWAGGIVDPAARTLDLIGLNHYHSGQWDCLTGQRLWWHLQDARRISLLTQLRSVSERYDRPMIIAETSHVGAGRAQWLHEVAADVQRARDEAIPLLGICLYPLVDRPDWADATYWHHSGLWDADEASPEQRILCTEYAAVLSAWQRHLPLHHQPGKMMPCLIVFSHLRWNFVYQRPQHLMSRLASEFRILFIEEPMHTDGPARLEVTPRASNLEVLVPHTPETDPGFSNAQLPWIAALLDEYLATHDVGDQVAWFYTPMALPLLDVLTPSAVVYDCMDELASFNFAPHELREREEQLLAQADFVLTGGPALYEAKRDRHPQVICLPSAVDAAHFDPARLHRHGPRADDAALLQGHLRQPRIGFFGVIDERFDAALIAEMAAAHPEWELVMAGPVVKIDPASLPLAPNIHWLGSQPYELLPYLLAGWDVSLLPFLINESTRFISPTKTLEYMAGNKPIVSTPVRDVVGLYGENVRFGSSAAEIIRQCQLALAEGEPARSLRIAHGRATVTRSSWDNAALTVLQLLHSTLGSEPAPSTLAALISASG